MSKGARNRAARERVRQARERTLQLFSHEKARPGVGAPEREARKGMNLLEQVDFVAYLTNTYVYSNTVPGEKQHLDLHLKNIDGAEGAPPILRYIQVGEENAVDVDLLAQNLGIDVELLGFAVYILCCNGHDVCLEDDGRLYLVR